VIVAGGRGTRLGALTADLPKALVEVGGRPFLDWLIESVRSRGFGRFLLLLGHRADQIAAHAGNGARWGVSIETVRTDPDDETGRRFLAAVDRLDDLFLFLYCDNLWPMPIEAMNERFAASGAPAMVTVYANEDGFTRDNVRVGPDGRVTRYDPTRQEPGLRGVEIGYAFFESGLLSRVTSANVSLQDALYPELIAHGELLAFPTEHRYYSISKPERLADAARFVTGSPAVIVDRDGVLNEKPPRAQYVRRWSEFQWLPGALEALAALTGAGYRTIVVSNQAGIGRGVMSEADLADIHRHMLSEARDAGATVEAVYHCPHDWDADCACRKPKPGMLLHAQRDHALDLTRTPFIGDDERDGQAAAAAGCPFLLVEEGRSLLDCVRVLLARDTTAVTA
jgi:D-glycero-D-manno-heptose 1,7-bisphosphate phosphatase